jgi:hypothetical protein
VAKKTRIFQKLFAESADTADVGQFGSLYDASPVTSKDPTIIQALSHWVKGWKEAVIAVRRPSMQDFNGVLLVAFYQLCYLLETGIPEYDASTTYYTNAFCQVSGVIYKSLIDTNIGNAPASNPTKWAIVVTTSGVGDLVDKSSSYGAQVAATDVEIRAFCEVGNNGYMAFYTDANADPVKVKDYAHAGNGVSGEYCNVGGVVKKGNYWKIVATGTPTVSMTPLGS